LLEIGRGGGSVYYQKTLRQVIECGGIGLHSGRKVLLRLLPGLPDSGIVFRRIDQNGLEIPASAANVQRVDFATTLGVGSLQVKTVEHLLGAFYGLGVDNAVVELDSAEVPIMDGSAAPFVYLIREAGLVNQNRTRRYLRVVRPLEVQEKDRWIKVLPSDDLRVTYTIAFNHPLIHQQTLTIPINEATFEDQVAPARTFGFMRDVEALRVRGLALGGSVDNAIVLGESKTLNSDLRFVNEFVRHKILDALGDLSLMGYPLKAHVMVFKGGHRLHTEMANLLRTSLAINEIESSEEGWSASHGLASPFA
jgi:UDP-3-O-[3-hydroxymyristoyl] N-acetylglucosamine deacetylase